MLETHAAQTSTVTAEMVLRMRVTTSCRFFHEDMLIFYWNLNKKYTERAEAVHNIHTYNKLRHNNIGTRQHGTSGSLYDGIEYDVYRRVFNLSKVA